MTRFFCTTKRIFLAALLLGSTALSSQAQLPTDAEQAARSSGSAERIDQQLRDKQQAPSVSPSVRVKDLILQDVPEGAADIHFNLTAISFDGASVYSDEELRSIYAGKLGTTVSLAEIYAIATAVTNKYRNDGYILTQVIVPPQTIEEGIVRLQVVEGRINSTTIEGQEGAETMALMRAYVNRIPLGKPLNVKDLERALLLLNDLPGIEARSVLSPAEGETGASDLQIIVTRDPFDGMLGVDNFGSRYLGQVQGSAAGSLNSFFGHNERITAQFVVAPDFEDTSTELAYVMLAYAQPVGTRGTNIEASMSYTDTEPGYNLEEFDVEGRSQVFSLRTTHPFIRSRAENLSGRVGFDIRNVHSKNNLEPRAREDRIRSVRIGGRYEFLDTLWRAGVNAVDLEYSQGVGFLGASDEGDANLTRPLGDPQYSKLAAELQRLQSIAPGINMLLQARGQIANKALLSAEEFGVGGPDLGRAFDPSEIVGDDGLAGKLELQWNRPVEWNFVQDYQVYGFYDAGRVWNDDATTSSTKTDTITSTGLGLRADFLDQTEAGLAVAFPLNRDVQTQKDRDPRVYFNLSRRF